MISDLDSVCLPPYLAAPLTPYAENTPLAVRDDPSRIPGNSVDIGSARCRHLRFRRVSPKGNRWEILCVIDVAVGNVHPVVTHARRLMNRYAPH